MAGRDHSVEIIDLSGVQVALLDKDGLALAGASAKDRLKVNSKIVDYRNTFTVWMPAAAQCVAGNVWIADDRYVIESIREAHLTAADAGGAMTIGVAKGTVTPANSTAQHSTAINLNGAANTVQNIAITTQTTLDVNDRVCIKNVATTTNLVGAAVTVVMRRVL